MLYNNYYVNFLEVILCMKFYGNFVIPFNLHLLSSTCMFDQCSIPNRSSLSIKLVFWLWTRSFSILSHTYMYVDLEVVCWHHARNQYTWICWNLLGILATASIVPGYLFLLNLTSYHLQLCQSIPTPTQLLLPEVEVVNC